MVKRKRRTIIKARCEECGKEFVTATRSARFCGVACRVANHRRLKLQAAGFDVMRAPKA